MATTPTARQVDRQAVDTALQTTPKKSKKDRKVPSAPKKPRKQAEELQAREVEAASAAAQKEYEETKAQVDTNQMSKQDYNWLVASTNNEQLQKAWETAKERAIVEAGKAFVYQHDIINVFHFVGTHERRAQRERDRAASTWKCRCMADLCHCYDNGPRN